MIMSVALITAECWYLTHGTSIGLHHRLIVHVCHILNHDNYNRTMLRLKLLLKATMIKLLISSISWLLLPSISFRNKQINKITIVFWKYFTPDIIDCPALCLVQYQCFKFWEKKRRPCNGKHCENYESNPPNFIKLLMKNWIELKQIL